MKSEPDGRCGGGGSGGENMCTVGGEQGGGEGQGRRWGLEGGVGQIWEDRKERE